MRNCFFFWGGHGDAAAALSSAMSGDRPTLSDLVDHNPLLANATAFGLDPGDAVARMPGAYFSEYDPATVARHVGQLCALSIKEPYTLDASRLDDRRVRLTIITIDDSGLLSLLTGILGSAGFDISEGSVFTMARATSLASATSRSRTTSAASPDDAQAGHARRASGSPYRGGSRRNPYDRRYAATPRAELPDRRIVDQFVGTIADGIGLDEFFTDLTRRLDLVIPNILPGGDRQEARRLVNEAVAARLRSDQSASVGSLYPVDVSFADSAPGHTVMIVRGEDTPFFLYALSASLSLQQVSIESVRIQTQRHTISDRFELLTSSGEPITDPGALDRLRFSVLLTKQFTYYLGVAPDPYVALIRFESLSSELAQQSDSGIERIVRSPHVLGELAQLLGASDFLWEDFIRLQYETLLPMLTDGADQLSAPPESQQERLDQALAGCDSVDQTIDALNEFKDRESYLIDLDHILDPDRDFFFLSRRLTALAETVVRTALRISWEQLTARYGVPRTVAGIEAAHAMFGLGKLGGRALGYASDIELLFVYSDSGMTDGAEPIQNAEFFERLVTDTTGCIRTRREGIFAVDTRLRPHGSAGPLAVSLESFNKYYGRGGDAHSYERLALTRLRAIAGDPEFGARVEQLRDDLIYGADSIALAEIRDLRARQFSEKTRGTNGMTNLNAKFSPGGLVDLEYGLQFLLVQHGRTNPGLRTRSLHSALDELGRLGLMDSDEVHRLTRAYQFLRKLINGLRMLRGNARDLFLPRVDSLEYEHLARRMGYQNKSDLTAAEQLHIDFETRTAGIRAFVERYLGRESIPGEPTGNAADLILSADPPGSLVRQITESAGLSNPTRALANLRSLAGSGEQTEVFVELVILVWPALRTSVEPDMALNNWERYASRTSDPTAHYRSLLRQPRMMELMLRVFAASQFLSDTLVRNPEFLEWSLDSRVVNAERTDDQMRRDLGAAGLPDAAADRRKAIVRTVRKRELLRIGTRDICLGVELATITRELSALARAFVQAELEAVYRETETPPPDRTRFAILAFGKLGGNELNYSSDIDLLGVYDDTGSDRERDQRLYSTVLETIRRDLSEHTTDGYAYRVDFRLRPYGSSGPLVQPLASIVDYYESSAAAVQHKQSIQRGPGAGTRGFADRFIDLIRPSALRSFAASDIRAGIDRLRDIAIDQSRRRLRSLSQDDTNDIKNGEGGIRDIEFLVQGLQMVHANECPEVLSGNTLDALDRMLDAKLMDGDLHATLRADYVELRRLEHFLQVYDDRQTHTLPSDRSVLESLARRTYGSDATADSFVDRLTQLRSRVRKAYRRFVDGEQPDA
ncbi:MAG: glutamate-ammonia-ligase adenylyltransferase [Spirochaetaceae bacterium]|nr:MAG: glutamate-ammonia-ligase adenylyltransferase [Spirochaetaceae bacterium]